MSHNEIFFDITWDKNILRKILPSSLENKLLLKEGGILFYLCPSVRPSVCPSVLPSVSRYFSSHVSQQLLMAEIWYFVTIFILVRNIVGSVFGPVIFLLPVCRRSWFFYTLNIYAHFSSHFSQQLLMAEIWYLVTSFI